MTLLITAMVFLLFSSGAYLVMRKNTFEVLIGTFLLAHASFLALLAQGGWSSEESPPILKDVRSTIAASYADPLPMALILTAIVISFGVSAYVMVLVVRGSEESPSEALAETGREEGEP